MADSRESQDDSDQVGGRQGQPCETCMKKHKVRTATLFCVECKLYQCDKCSKVHEMYDLMSGHKIVQATQASSLKPVHVFDMKGLDKCKDHNKTLEFYCRDEQKLCCNTCAIASHRGCAEVIEITGETKKSSFNPSGVESTIQELQDAAGNLADLSEKIKSSTPGKLEAVLEYIDNIRKTLNGKLDQIEVALKEQFQSLENRRLELLNTCIAITKSISEDLHGKQEYLRTAKSCGTPKQLLIASRVIENQILPYKSTLKTQRSSLYTVDCSVECNGHLQEILKSNIKLITFSINKIPIDSSIPPMKKAVQLENFKSDDLKQGKGKTEESLYSAVTEDWFL